MQLEVVGGDVKVVATLDEITRVSVRLRQVEGECREALSEVDWNLNPDVLLRLRLLLVAEEAAQLASRCLQAREQYYDLEVGNASLISRSTDLATGALDGLTGNGAANPFLNSLRVLGSVSLTAGLAIAGGLWGTGRAQVDAVRAAAQVLPRAFGDTSPQSMLHRLISNLERLGVRSETASFVIPGTVVPVRPAVTVSEHLGRLTHAYQNPASGITVEKYDSSGGRQFVVYVPGTQSAGLGTVISAGVGKLNNPLDLRSNLNAMASPGLAASERAVQQALSAAGAGGRSGDRVLFVGHSQGALVSANIASTKQSYQVSGLISVAGPIAHLNLDGVPTLALEHSDDPVPALSGSRNPLTLDLVTVRGTSGEQDLIGAHAVTSYRDLATAIDGSENESIQTVLARMQSPPSVGGTAQQFLLRRSSGLDSEATNGGVICTP